MNKKLVTLFALATLLILPIIALAAETPSEWIGGIISRLLSIVVWPIFFAAAVIMLVWAGFLFLTAQGDATKITTAKKAVLWAVVGIVIAIVAFSAVNIIRSVIAPTATVPGSPPPGGGGPPSGTPIFCTDDSQCGPSSGGSIDLRCDCLGGVPCAGNSGICS